MSQAWALLQSGPGESSFNMALDQALLEATPRLGQPVLRFYSWTERAASFGYFQKIAEVNCLTPLRPLVRRPTGGGIVPHDADWTYSLVFPTRHEWYSLAATESYQRVHEWIQAAFAEIGVVADLAPANSDAPPGQCFVGYVKSDVLCGGRKIAGAAQRRTRDGLLIQGSVQPPLPGLAKADWQKALCDVAHFKHGVQWTELALDLALNERARELAEQKYSQPAYNQKR
jgi:lipoate-protein ligase A